MGQKEATLLVEPEYDTAICWTAAEVASARAPWVEPSEREPRAGTPGFPQASESVGHGRATRCSHNQATAQDRGKTLQRGIKRHGHKQETLLQSRAAEGARSCQAQPDVTINCNLKVASLQSFPTQKEKSANEGMHPFVRSSV